MVILVRLFGVLIIAMGIIFTVKQDSFKKYIAFWSREKSIKKGGLVSILIGVIFLIAAPECRLSGVITVLGIWAIIKGVILLLIKQKKINAYLDWWAKKSHTVVRALGFFAIAIGILLIYSA